MITLIGTRNSAIGFGLCGIKDIREVGPSVTDEELLRMVLEAGEIIMIDEALYARVKGRVAKTFIRIPDTAGGTQDIDALVKDTIGISIKIDKP